MISELDIWRAANLLIRQHRDSAELAAARLQDLMLDRAMMKGAFVAADQAGSRGAADATRGQGHSSSASLVEEREYSL
jgi:hypothetical protein